VTSRQSLHPVVRATGWVSFLTALGSEMIYPLLPEFVVGTLGARRSTLGLIEGLAEGTPAVVRWFAGSWADRAQDRKPLILAGYALSSLVKPLIGATRLAAAAVAPWLVLALRVLDKVGKGVRGAPRDALVADLSAGHAGRAFGYQRAMDHAGAMGGALLAFLLLAVLGLPLGTAIAASAVPGLLTVLAIVLFVRDPVGGGAGRGPAPAVDPGVPSTYRRYLVAAVLFALANSSDAFLLLRARELGMPVLTLPLAWAALHAVKASTSYLGGSLSDRLGRRPLLAVGWILYAGVYAGFSFAEGPLAAWALFLVYGLFFGATEGVAKAFVADLVPRGRRGRAFGLLGTLEGVLLVPASVLVGVLWDATGSGELPLLLGAGFALLAAAWLLLFVRPARVS